MMNAIEDYSLEVKEALSKGIDVPVCSGMTCYTVQYSKATGALRDWNRAGETYFANRRSAENYIIYKIYASTCSAIQYYLELFSDGMGNIPASDAEYLANDMQAGTHHYFDLQIVYDFLNCGESERLLEWFLNTPYQDIRAWHEACWFSSEYFFMERYDLDESTFDFYPLHRLSGEQGLDSADAAISRITREMPIRELIPNPQAYVIPSQEAIEVAIALGAKIEPYPKMSFFVVISHPVYDARAHSSYYYPLYKFSSEREAMLVRIRSQLSIFHGLNTEAPWTTFENSFMNEECDDWVLTDDWYRGVVRWINEHSILEFDTLIENFIVKFFGENRAPAEVLALHKRYIEDNFELTPELIRAVETKAK